MNKKESNEKKRIAQIYYMAEEPQKSIADKIHVSEVTLSKWVKQGGWDLQRTANKITHEELIRKILLKINALLDNFKEGDDFGKLTDQLCKAAAAIKKLKEEAGLVEVIDVFMTYNKWLSIQQAFYSELTPELMKIINKFQDIFVSELAITHAQK
jgi:hypothetical protein